MSDKVYCKFCKHQYKNSHCCTKTREVIMPDSYLEPSYKVMLYVDNCETKNENNDCPDFEPIPKEKPEESKPIPKKKPWWKFWR